MRKYSYNELVTIIRRQDPNAYHPLTIDEVLEHLRQTMHGFGISNTNARIFVWPYKEEQEKKTLDDAYERAMGVL